MAKIDYALLRELIEKWDTANAFKLFDEVIHDNRFLDDDNKVKEPFKTLLLLKVLGDKPVRLLVLLYRIQTGDKTSRPDLAEFLGEKFDDGTPRQEIKELLDCLEKLEILQGEETAPKGKKTRAYSIKKLDLHLSQKNLEGILSGEEFAWSHFDFIDFIDKEYVSKCKLKDFDGTDVNFRPARMFEDLIRCGASASIAWEITSIVVNEIAEKRIKDRQAVNKTVAEELRKKDPNVAEKFLSTNPLGLKLKGPRYNGQLLTHSLVEEVFQEYLRGNKMRCLPIKLYREILLVTLSQCMKDTQTKHEIEESELPGILHFAVYRVYGKSLDEILSDPKIYLKKSKLQIGEAAEEVDSCEVPRTCKRLLGAFSSFLTYFSLGVGLLPEKDEVATVALIKDILAPKQTENNVEPRTEEKKIKNDLLSLFKNKAVPVDRLLEFMNLLLSIEREETSGITLRDPSILRISLKNVCAFLSELEKTFEQS